MIVGGLSFAFFYTWHIMDWLYWGDNYEAFLSHSSNAIKKQKQGRLRFLVFPRRERLAHASYGYGSYGYGSCCYLEDTEDALEAQLSLSF